MLPVRDRGTRSGGAFQWFAQRISGAALLIALLIHFWVLHFFPADPHGEITFDIVMQRLAHPLFKTVDLIFLVTAIYHGMNGLILVVHDYLHKPALRMFVVGSLWVVGIWFLILGSITILSLKGS